MWRRENNRVCSAFQSPPVGGRNSIVVEVDIGFEFDGFSPEKTSPNKRQVGATATRSVSLHARCRRSGVCPGGSVVGYYVIRQPPADSDDADRPPAAQCCRAALGC